MPRNFLAIDPEQRPDALRGLSSPVRVKILKLLQRGVGIKDNDIANALGQPQSTAAP
jgi:predicted transcriptional regulator